MVRKMVRIKPSIPVGHGVASNCLEQLLGLHLIRRYQAADSNMRPAQIGLVRHLARQADASVAALAQKVLDELTMAG
jgi:hypothetical protein